MYYIFSCVCIIYIAVYIYSCVCMICPATLWLRDKRGDRLRKSQLLSAKLREPNYYSARKMRALPWSTKQPVSHPLARLLPPSPLMIPRRYTYGYIKWSPKLPVRYRWAQAVNGGRYSFNSRLSCVSCTFTPSGRSTIRTARLTVSGGDIEEGESKQRCILYIIYLHI